MHLRFRDQASRFLVHDHGSGRYDDPERFHVTLTFDEHSDKKTVLTLRELLPTKEQRAIKIGFGAVELGYETLEKLAEHLRSPPERGVGKLRGA